MESGRPAVGDGAREGAKLAFGSYVNTVYRVEKANVILSLDSDFLGSGPGHIRYAREFSRRRKLNGPNDSMNRLYVVEPTPSVTGANADHRLPLRASEVELFARALAGKLGLGGSAAFSPDAEKWLDAVAKDLQKHKGASLVVAGEQQPAEVYALAHTINAALGNHGDTAQWLVYIRRDVSPFDGNYLEHSGNGQGLVSLIGLYLPADNRAAFYRGIFHIVYRRVNAEDGLSDDNIMQIDDRRFMPDHLKLFGILKL